MKLFQSVSLMIFFITLAGCSGTSSFTRANTSSAQRERDFQGCEYEAWKFYPKREVVTGAKATTNCGKFDCYTTVSDVTSDKNHSKRHNETVRCMEGRGYEHDGFVYEE